MNVTYIGFGHSTAHERSLDGSYCIFNGEWYVHPSETLEQAQRTYNAIMRGNKEPTHIARLKYDDEIDMAVPVECYTVGGDEW